MEDGSNTDDIEDRLRRGVLPLTYCACILAFSYSQVNALCSGSVRGYYRVLLRVNRCVILSFHLFVSVPVQTDEETDDVETDDDTQPPPQRRKLPTMAAGVIVETIHPLS